MKIIIGTKALDLTAPLKVYIEEKLLPLAKFVKKFETKGEAELRVELLRTTRHHKKGEVFMAVLELRLPNKVLGAEEDAKDIRTAIDNARTTLRNEIEKYKAKSLEARRGEEE